MRRMVWTAVFLLMPAGVPFSAPQDSALPIPPNVTIGGVPPIPMSLTEAVASYGRYRQALAVAWHPTGRRLVIATSFGNAPQLHDVRFPGGARSQLTFVADGVAARPGAAFHAGGSFVFQKDTAGGGEANQLFRYAWIMFVRAYLLS